MNVMFLPVGWDDYLSWQEADRKQIKRLNRLIEECRRDPYAGIGKPEPLKHDRSGWWSRRITEEHRLVYRVVGQGDEAVLEIAQCRNHYK
jgi:toxin YoeB